MANIKSAIKRVKVTQTKTLRNQMVRSQVKTIVKKYESAVALGNAEDAKKLYSEATHELDKAAAKGIIHKNCAARKKSRLAVKLNALSAK